MNTAVNSIQMPQEILQPVETTKRSTLSALRVYCRNLFGKLPWRSSMLNVTVQNLGDASVLHCRGRILFGNTNLYKTALSQKGAGMLVLDLTQVQAIDAGGLGVLVELRAWASANGIQLRLLNVTRAVERVLKSTRLNSIFEACSVPEMFHLLARADGLEAPLKGLRTLSSADRELREDDALPAAS